MYKYRIYKADGTYIDHADSYAIKMDLIKVNESKKTERPRLDKFEATFYNASELEILFNTFRGDRMELIPADDEDEEDTNTKKKKRRRKTGGEE